MYFYNFKDLPQEFVTQKYSTAFGGLLTGDNIEVGLLHFNAGEGAVPHAHPQEQIMYVISGRLRVRFGDETAELGPGQAFKAPPNVEHQVTAVEDTEVLSCKNVIAGRGHKLAE
ncbi:MAG: cupin domain-containing protein [Chloroflexota bacterium]|nr:MAG: cupin domain-containing protein [Chloroflexota bacterium]